MLIILTLIPKIEFFLVLLFKVIIGVELEFFHACFCYWLKHYYFFIFFKTYLLKVLPISKYKKFDNFKTSTYISLMRLL